MTVGVFRRVPALLFYFRDFGGFLVLAQNLSLADRIGVYPQVARMSAHSNLK